jgi:hypothetical protein
MMWGDSRGEGVWYMGVEVRGVMVETVYKHEVLTEVIIKVIAWGK